MDYLTKQILTDNPELKRKRDQGDFIAYLKEMQVYWLQYKRISKKQDHTPSVF